MPPMEIRQEKRSTRIFPYGRRERRFSNMKFNALTRRIVRSVLRKTERRKRVMEKENLFFSRKSLRADAANVRIMDTTRKETGGYPHWKAR